MSSRGLTSVWVRERGIIAAIPSLIVGTVAFYWIIYPSYTCRYRSGVKVKAGDGVRSGLIVVNAAFRPDQGAG